jgi:hypothetical protein
MQYTHPTYFECATANASGPDALECDFELQAKISGALNAFAQLSKHEQNEFLKIFNDENSNSQEESED